jgi:thiol-disulfide isomerase/thioredoxin
MNMAYLAAAMISLAAVGDDSAPASYGAQIVQSGYGGTNGENVLLDFRADWCGPCRQMDPVVGSILAEGYPVRRVNVDQERDLANRYNVQGIPCFVMVVNGREVDRAVGVTDRSRLMAMFSRNGVGAGMNSARTQSPGMGVLSSGIPFPTTPPDADQKGFLSGRFAPRADTFAHSDTMAGGDDWAAHNSDDATYSIPRDNPYGNQRNRSNSDTFGDSVPPAYESLLRASVRLRIEDATGISRGSGTIIDARQGEALIITCGHMFREAEKNGKIMVDLFGPGAPQSVAGKLIDYDLKSEVGLIRIVTHYPLTAARMAPPGYVVRSGDKVVSMGCDGGADATARETHVTSINRYVGSPNLQVAFQPVQGRSGGGLFTPEGWVVGVCYAADPEANEGLFTALPALCDELDRVGLSFVYREPSAGGQYAAGGRQPAAHALETAQTDVWNPDGKQPSADGPGVMLDRQVQPASKLQPMGMTPTALSDRNLDSSPARSGRTPQTLSPQEMATLQSLRYETQNAEVICIVRPKGNPAESEIIVLNHASPELLEQLTAGQEPAATRR